MNRPLTRSSAIDHVATTLLPRASVLTRLLMRSGARSISRTEAGLLGTLLERPHRITELAETEALAQPTVTQVVGELERRGLVTRARSASDGRVVLVALSDQGRSELEATREHYRGVLRATADGLTDEEVSRLVEASDVLARMIESLQDRAEQ